MYIPTVYSDAMLNKYLAYLQVTPLNCQMQWRCLHRVLGVYLPYLFTQQLGDVGITLRGGNTEGQIYLVHTQPRLYIQLLTHL